MVIMALTLAILAILISFIALMVASDKD